MPASYTSTCTTDSGIQQLSFTVRDNASSQLETVTVTKRQVG